MFGHSITIQKYITKNHHIVESFVYFVVYIANDEIISSKPNES